MKTQRLYPREKECLRLLLYPMRPADIAVAMDIKVSTVNSYLQSARRKLGASDSLSAARLFRETETPLGLEGVKISGLEPVPSVPQDIEANAPSESQQAGENWELPFALRGRPWNGLDIKWRATWPVVLFFLFAMGVSAVSSGAASLSVAYTMLSR